MAQVRHKVSKDRPRLVTIGPMQLEGILTVPEPVMGLVIFAHGSGSSRLSPRNTYVAEQLQRRSIATLLFDLLTERGGERSAQRLPRAPACQPSGGGGRLGLLRSRDGGFADRAFRCEHGSAAALVAAAANLEIAAVVSRGGRPDLAGDALSEIRAPTLLIVGGADTGVLELNQDAFARLNCVKALHVVPGATHLFEEPGALDEVVKAAGDWFAFHLQQAQRQ